LKKAFFAMPRSEDQELRNRTDSISNKPREGKKERGSKIRKNEREFENTVEKQGEGDQIDGEGIAGKYSRKGSAALLNVGVNKTRTGISNRGSENMEIEKKKTKGNI